MKTRSLSFVTMILILALLFSACSQDSSRMQDGYYTAEAASFDMYGWKEYITIYVSDNKIVTVEYDAQNASGFLKSWDMVYMRTMSATAGTYPNEYARAYKVALLNWQNPDEIEAVQGATAFHNSFQMLAEAAIAQARAGDKQVILIELPSFESQKTEG